MHFLTSFLLLILLPLIGSLPHLPPNIKLCRKASPIFESCVAKNMALAIAYFARGSASLGIPILEPFHVDRISIEPNKKSSVVLEHKYQRVLLHNITRGLDINNMKIDKDKCFWTFTATVPSTVMEANYAMRGKVLFFKINCHGKAVISLTNLAAFYQVNCTRFIRKSKKHLRITHMDINLVPEKIHYAFEDLYPADPQLSETIAQTINENALTIFNEVKHSFEKVFAKAFAKTANVFFNKIPQRMIFIE